MSEPVEHQQPQSSPATAGPGRWHQLKDWAIAHKYWLIGAGAGFAVILAIGLVLAFHHKPKPKPQPVQPVAQKPPEPPKPTTEPSPLTGIEMEPVRAEHPVVAAVIENLYPDARPQSGLSSAGIVYEALAEGGITRYLAYFGDTMPPDLGPIRSIRTYFVRWGLEYNVPVLHAGGNADALDMIQPLGLKDMNALTFSQFSRRTSRYSPHNLYTTGPQIEAFMKYLNYYTKPNFTPWPRKDDAKSASPAATSITIDPSTYNYQVIFKYDPADNSYARYLRGAPDVDVNGNTPIKPKNVIVIKIPTSYGVTRIGEQTVIMQQVGSGSGTLFEDGSVIPINWSKASDKAPTVFTDSSGQPVKFDRGQTWVTVIPTDRTYSYK